MVSIQGVAQHISRPVNIKRKKSEKYFTESKATSPSVIAKAVSQGIRSLENPQELYQQIHYDLPDGKNSQALAIYMAVKNQARREELIALFGVDMFV